MAQLHELLKEDQEPFLLKSYIADKRGQLKRPSPRTQLQVKKRRPISEVSNFPRNLCKNACFFSLQDSPDLRKSPLFEFSSPAAKSPCKSPNAIFLQIPTRTAALLVEAAMRIQKQSTSSKPKNHGFGLIGSFLKRLKTRTQKREIEEKRVKISAKDIQRWDSSVGRRQISSEDSQIKMEEDKFDSGPSLEHRQSAYEISNTCEVCFASSNVNSRPSSEVWSLEMDTSTSSQSDYTEAILGSTDCVCCEAKVFCDSPFRFVLETSPSPSGSRTPEFTSPATSPVRHRQEEKEGLKNFQVEEEEEDKEQCSPVSVLDPPFEDDDEEHDEEDEEHGFDLECSYAIMQRTKKQLMQKLRRFERLAELDPIELEKRMLEEGDDEDEDEEYNSIGDIEAESEECDDDESKTSESSWEDNLEGLIREVLCKSRFPSLKRIPEDLKRLVSDLIVEEQREVDDGFSNREEVVRRVCKRFNSWNEVESNTIDMMVEQDFRKELNGWKQNQGQVGETAVEVELAIFSLLVEELAKELN
ncbi:uncharacterized protein LOC126797728 [Argentina anserina]|uniref:uncharacterized protein LOC126797728 n=1 Tax=Argentina anserina TaxID=57926 RepID=UPI0021763406|nr:uncharacterized protein LOC126797728 [Potentilla anserina]